MENPVMMNQCGSGAGWSSDLEMDDVLSLRDADEEVDENSDA